MDFVWYTFKWINDIIDPYNLNPLPPEIVHLFHQHDYNVNKNIISDMIKLRELINLNTENEIEVLLFVDVLIQNLD